MPRATPAPAPAGGRPPHRGDGPADAPATAAARPIAAATVIAGARHRARWQHHDRERLPSAQQCCCAARRPAPASEPARPARLPDAPWRCARCPGFRARWHSAAQTDRPWCGAPAPIAPASAHWRPGAAAAHRPGPHCWTARDAPGLHRPRALPARRQRRPRRRAACPTGPATSSGPAWRGHSHSCRAARRPLASDGCS